MQVAHVSASASRQAGGVATVLWALCAATREINVDSCIVTYNDKYLLTDSIEGVSLYCCDVIGPKKLGYSPVMEKQLNRINGLDIIHTHGLWMCNGLHARRASQKRKLPLLLSTHGMLEPYSINRSKIQKKIVSWLYENKNIDAVDCIHAASTQEALNIQKFGINKPIAVIPFGIDQSVDDISDAEQSDLIPFQHRNKRFLLFLSRIHPKKGLSDLVIAWSKLCKKYTDWHLVIAGPDELNTLSKINNIINNKKINEYVSIVGPVNGIDKRRLYSSASLFVLPTLSENFGFVIPEALTHRCPVITTTATPWEDLVTYNCGWHIETGLDSLLLTLEDALKKNKDDLIKMGENGKRMVMERYSWHTTAKSFQHLYSWLLHNEGKPQFVM